MGNIFKEPTGRLLPEGQHSALRLGLFLFCFVYFLILAFLLTTWRRQSGNVTSSVVIATHLEGCFLQQICFASKYRLKITSSQ